MSDMDSETLGHVRELLRLTEVPLFVVEVDKRFLLNMDEWPTFVGFSDILIHDRRFGMRLHDGHIELKLANARAIYRVNSHHDDTYHCTLVYSEGPDG